MLNSLFGQDFFFIHFQMVEFVGLSGPIKFDTSGLRTQFEMDLMELQMGGLVGDKHCVFFYSI